MEDFHWILLALTLIAAARAWLGPPPVRIETAAAPVRRWRSLGQAMAAPGDNLLLLRLLAASAVIYGHSYALCGIPGAVDHIARHNWGYGLYSGSIAVQVFFVVSGFLVSGAWLRRPDLAFFLRSRVLRIVPAYLACLVISALVLGGLLTTLPRSDYFAHADTWRYIWKNLTFSTEMAWTLPGVFTGNPLPNTVNGSLWTLVVEVRVYLWLAIFGLLGLLDRRERLFYALAILAAYLYAPLTLPMMPMNEFLRLGGFFAAGCAFYRWRDDIPFHGGLVVVLAALAVIAHGSEWFMPLYGLALAYAVFWFAYGPRFLLFFNRLGDYSYGVYLWGFPLQQLVALWLPTPTPTRITLIALPLALIAGALSWHLLEQPMLRFKRRRAAESFPAPTPAPAGAA
ncbi:peptidoglycan/LPS O-acetylase OafA/YrhL [Tahibacter aquaticus]|uniref:Peptidoglycan/LPS O-acetylase OafA/YrhL n=1 Tax=Tahibacter aquaticus TaxID=520092 RepID=A0A4R6Z2T6_9GAMM|nr:acyltransferase [Tahibacter aquaticus]TDR45834.1 peptidoglycan/LPS O-acetylase OafA/YrhL [Tahibacter aquaticus]